MNGSWSLPSSCAPGLLLVASACTSTAVPTNVPVRTAVQEQARPSAVLGLQIGARSLDDDVAWDEIESPLVVGFEAAAVGDPIGIEGGFSVAGDSTNALGVEVTNTFLELYLGARATFGSGPVFPYLGAGGTALYALVEGAGGGVSVNDEDLTAGLYVHGGLLFQLGTNFFLGADARLVTGTSVELFDIDTDADYTQLTLFLGWGR